MMNKQLKIILCIVLVIAVTLMILCGLHLADLRAQLRDTGVQLAESRNTWESIDSDKRLIQDELKGIRDELKEANQTITEWADQSVSIQAEIDELRSQIDALKSGKQ